MGEVFERCVSKSRKKVDWDERTGGILANDWDRALVSAVDEIAALQEQGEGGE